jgi:hypothetical protein
MDVDKLAFVLSRRGGCCCHQVFVRMTRLHICSACMWRLSLHINELFFGILTVWKIACFALWNIWSVVPQWQQLPLLFADIQQWLGHWQWYRYTNVPQHTNASNVDQTFGWREVCDPTRVFDQSLPLWLKCSCKIVGIYYSASSCALFTELPPLVGLPYQLSTVIAKALKCFKHLLTILNTTRAFLDCMWDDQGSTYRASSLAVTALAEL